jgi:hypothetical protein
MIMRILTTAALVSILTAQHSFAFQPALSTPGRVVGSKSSTSLNMAASDEERAAVLSAYMVKAHEEKIKAVRAAESAKDAGMQALKDELEALRKSTPAATSASAPAASTGAIAVAGGESLMEYSKEELIGKVLQYQNFMKEYIVKAQDQKALAIKTAERTMEQKYQLLIGAAPSAPLAVDKESNELFAKRNAAVSAAGAAGKSRWGDAETQRAAVGAATSVSGAPAAPAAPQVVPPEVLAADHGLRNDGGVGGLTLAERIAQGSKTGGSAAAAPAAPAAPVASPLYAKRNAQVVAAAAAGKSRWGSEEVSNIQNLATLPAASTNTAKATVAVGAPKIASSQSSVVPPEVAVADHGLRNDGGVGGLTLAERVSMGLSAAATPAAPAAPVASPLYAKRNAQVLAAAAAGKSRWGSEEINNIQNFAALPVATETASAPKVAAVAAEPIVVPKEVQEADHGLRNDGGVGGLTLAERVSMGSRAGSGGVAPAATTAAAPKVSPLYIKRNARVAAAAAAGKSRWGSEENARIQKLVALPAGSTDSMPVPNGAGASLEGRVNLGAQFAKK